MDNDVRRGLYFVVGFILLSGCSGDSLTELKEAKGFTLYSILAAPQPLSPAKPIPTTQETFHGWRVIGKTEVVDPQKRKAIIDGLQAAVRKPDGDMPRCFEPRHAIRVKQYGLTVDYLICFECSRVHKYWFWEFHDVLSTRNQPQKTLNFYLKEAGIALDPAMKGEI